jgi:hypothetical protein
MNQYRAYDEIVHPLSILSGVNRANEQTAALRAVIRASLEYNAFALMICSTIITTTFQHSQFSSSASLMQCWTMLEKGRSNVFFCDENKQFLLRDDDEQLRLVRIAIDSTN